MLKVKLSVLMKLVKLLRSEPCLSNRNVCFGEAVIKRVTVSDADDITNLIPEIIGVKRIRRERFLTVVKLTLAACEMEALECMREPTCANAVKRLEIVHYTDLYGDIESISAIKKLLSDLFSLPAEPIGNVGKLGLSVLGLEFSKLRESI